MIKKFSLVMILLTFIVSVPPVLSDPAKIFTIQVITNKEKDNALREAKRLEAEKVSDIRVEKIGEQYVVRVGKYSRQTEGTAVLQKIRQAYPESMLRTAYDMPERQLYEGNPSPRKTAEPGPGAEKTTVKSAAPPAARDKKTEKSPPPKTVNEKVKSADRHRIDMTSEKTKTAPPAATPATPPATPPGNRATQKVTAPLEAPQVSPAAAAPVASLPPLPAAPQDGIIARAMKSYENHQYDQAGEMFYAITRQKNVDIPTYEKAVRRLADCYYFMGEQGFAGKHMIAAEHYKAILRNYPDPRGENELAYYRLALTYDKLKFYYEAGAAYDGLAKKYPDSLYNEEAMLGVGVMTKRIGRYAQAADRLQSYLKKYPAGKFRREALFSLAETYSDMKDLKNALQTYDDILKKWPNKADIPGDAILKLGCLQYEAGKYQEAISSLSYFLSIYPRGNQSRAALYALGASFYGSRQYRTAVQLFSQVIDTYPGSREAMESMIALANLGVLQRDEKIPPPMAGSKYFENPIASYDQVLSALPDSETMQRVLFLKARGLEKTGRNSEAFEISAGAVTRYPKGPFAEETAKVLRSAFKSLVNEAFAREDYISVGDLFFENFHKGFYGQNDEDALMKIAVSLRKLAFNKEALEMLNYMDGVCKESTARENMKKEIASLKPGDTPVPENLLSGGERLYMDGKYQEAAQWYEDALNSSDKPNKRWILYRLALSRIKMSDGNAARKSIASLKGGGEDPFWAKVADYVSGEDMRRGRYPGGAPN